MEKRELDAIRPKLTSALERSPNGVKCKDFLNDVLKRLGSKYEDILSVFDSYATKRAVYDRPGATGRAPFPAGSRKARLEIDLESPDLILTILHELTHGSGTTQSFRHPAIGRAAYESAVASGLLAAGREFFDGDPKLLNSKNETDKINEENKVDGSYFRALQDALKAACGDTTGGKAK